MTLLSLVWIVLAPRFERLLLAQSGPLQEYDVRCEREVDISLISTTGPFFASLNVYGLVKRYN